MTARIWFIRQKAPGHRPRPQFVQGAVVLFLLPALTFLAVFIVWPVLLSIQLSFYDWNGIAPVRTFVGLANWKGLVADSVFWKALANNLIVVVLSIGIQLPVAMALAVLLHRAGNKLKVFKI